MATTLAKAFASLGIVLIFWVASCSSAPTTSGVAPNDSVVDERTAKNHERAKYYTGKIWLVKKVTVRPSSLSHAKNEVLVQIEDAARDLRDLIFSDTHREYAKMAALHAGQEVEFDFSPIDGDPKLSDNGRAKVKYIRLKSVR